MSVEINGQNISFELDKAILIYKPTNGSQRRLCTLSSVENGVIQPGTPLTDKSVENMLKSMSGQKVGSLTYLPANVLAKSDDEVVWFVKPKKRTLLFDIPRIGMQKTSGEAYVPGLVFKFSYVTKDLLIFAFKGKNRPVMTTKLFTAPFSNANSNGLVCLGTVQISQTDGPEEITEKYFGSFFTGHQVSDEVNLYWKDALGSGKKFPEKNLGHSTRSLSDLMGGA